MKVLIVKTSSMGDVIHTLPAITDAARAMPNLQLDWVVEEAFAEIPAWHPSVNRVIPVAIRRWRKNPIDTLRGDEWKKFRKNIQQVHYDCIIDAQGLIKSALIARLSYGNIAGQDWDSAREPLASLAYHQKFHIPRRQHAVERTRQLFAQTLRYSLPEGTASGGLIRSDFGQPDPQSFSVMFLHGTTRPDKHWPEAHWIALAQHLTAAGVHIRLPWYNEIEKQRADRIAQVSSKIEVMPRSNLKQLAQALASSTAFVAVDTGLGHLGAALNVPGLSLYGPTDPVLIGAYGRNQIHVCGNTMQDISADQAFDAIRPLFPKAR